MTAIDVHLRIVGSMLIVLALAHIYFGRYLGWKDDCGKLTAVNRQIFFVHAFFICLVLALMGVLLVGFTETLTAPSPLARLVLIGMTIFWGMRLAFQWLVYDWSHWRGHRLHTIVHVAFTLLWSYFLVTFALALRAQYH